MFWLRNKKTNAQLPTIIWRPVDMGLFKSFNSLVLVSNVLRNEKQLKLCLFVCLFVCLFDVSFEQPFS